MPYRLSWDGLAECPAWRPKPSGSGSPELTTEWVNSYRCTRFGCDASNGSGDCRPCVEFADLTGVDWRSTLTSSYTVSAVGSLIGPASCLRSVCSWRRSVPNSSRGTSICEPEFPFQGCSPTESINVRHDNSFHRRDCRFVRRVYFYCYWISSRN